MGNKLDSALKERRTTADIEKSGVVPFNYFDDPEASIQRKSKTRKLTADFLEDFLENRFDFEEIADRGIIQNNNNNNTQLKRKRVSKTLESRLSIRRTPE